jgi:hypothetical protein
MSEEKELFHDWNFITDYLKFSKSRKRSEYDLKFKVKVNRLCVILKWNYFSVYNAIYN